MTHSMIPIPQVGSLDSPDLTGKSFIETKQEEKRNKELVAWARSQYSKMKSARSREVIQWNYNLSMYYGQQYNDLVKMKGGQRLLRVPKAPNHRVRHTVNLIRPMIRSEIARMTSQKPTATVTPATTSNDDMYAAQAGEQVWEFIQRRREFHTKMMRNAFWISITGTGFMKTWWDSDYNINTALLAGSEVPAVGDVLIDVVTPYNLLVPDLLEVDIENQPFVFEVYTRPVEWVKRFWPNVGDVNVDTVSRNEIIETSYFNVDDSSKPDSVLVMECWVKPGGTKHLPNGGMFTIIGDKLAQPPTDGMPYSHGEYPYAKFEHIPTGKFYGDSVLIDINPLQREYNKTRSHIIESKDLMGRPQLLVAEGSLDPTKITSRPGQIIPFKMGFPAPVPIPLTPLPSYVLQEQDRIKSDMEDISAQHSVTRGQVPGGGVTAATAINFLQEQDDSIMGPTYTSIETGTEKIARQALTLVVDKYEFPRIIEATGLDQSFDSYILKGSDIARGTNLRIEGGSALPQSKSARQAFLMDLVKMGAISPTDMLDMLDIGGIGKITERLRVDKKQAQRENLKMKQLTEEDIMQHEMRVRQGVMSGDPKYSGFDPNSGMPTVLPDTPATYPPIVPVNDWDNHAIHIREHNDYRKSQEFDTLPDFVKDEFDKHVLLHKKAIMTSMMTGDGSLMPSGIGESAPDMGDQEIPVGGLEPPTE